MQTFWRRMADFRPLLEEKSKIHDGSREQAPQGPRAQVALFAVPGRHGMTYTEEDWVDEEAISRRAPDE